MFFFFKYQALSGIFSNAYAVSFPPTPTAFSLVSLLSSYMHITYTHEQRCKISNEKKLRKTDRVDISSRDECN